MKTLILKCSRRMIANRTGSFQRCRFSDATSTIVTIAIITRTMPTTTTAAFTRTPRIMLIVIFACTVVIIIYTTIIARCRSEWGRRRFVAAGCRCRRNRWMWMVFLVVFRVLLMFCCGRRCCRCWWRRCYVCIFITATTFCSIQTLQQQQQIREINELNGNIFG